MNDDSKFIPVQDASKLLGVSIKTLHRWEEKGFLIPHRTAGNQRRYNVDEIEAFKNRGKKTALLNAPEDGVSSENPQVINNMAPSNTSLPQDPNTTSNPDSNSEPMTLAQKLIAENQISPI